MKVNQLDHYDLKTMRTLEEIKKDQDKAIFEFGAHLCLAEQWKIAVGKYADEYAALKLEIENKSRIEEEIKAKHE